MPQGKSKWTWVEDITLIKKAYEHRAHWGKVLTDLHTLHLAPHVEAADQLRRRFDTLSGPKSVLWRTIEVPSCPEPSEPVTGDQKRKVEQAHTARYVKAQMEQKEAQRLHAKVLKMKAAITDSTPETKSAIEKNIRRASTKRSEARQKVRSHWYRLSQMELGRQQAVIINFDRLYRSNQRQLQLEAALVEHITGRSVAHTLKKTPSEEDLDCFWHESIVPIAKQIQEDEADDIKEDRDEDGDAMDVEGESAGDDTRLVEISNPKDEDEEN